MIQVPFTEPSDADEWQAWRKRADKATKRVLENLTAGTKSEIRENVYKEMRQVFLDAFHGKCAYCEAKIKLDQHHGDVEHYRPKGRVTDDKGRPVTIASPEGPPTPHPGYPWLAYDWRNLLPACAACNRPGRNRQGRTVGKWDRFPVSRFRASSPGEESRERPLLLHPVFDDPDEHLGLDAETGIVFGKTRRGKKTIEVLDLNREGLPEERHQRYLEVSAVVFGAHAEHQNPALLRQWLETLETYRDGVASYSWPGRLAIADFAARGRS